MPLAAVAAAVITTGGAIYSANQQKDAAKTAANASATATQQQLAAQEAARQQIIVLNQPFVTGGTAAYQALLQRLGVTNGTAAGQGPPSPPSQPANNNAGMLDQARGVGDLGPPNKSGVSIDPASAGPPNASGPLIDGQPASVWDAYLAQYPDVAAWAASGHGDPNLGPNQTPEQAAAYHFQNSGQSEGRALTAAPVTPPAAPTPAGPAPPPNLFAGQPTDANGAPIFTRPTTAPTPTFGPSPTGPDVSKASFENSPYYQMGLATGQRNLNANFGARGLLQSGAAIQGAINYGQQNFATNYGNFFNQQQQLYQDQANQYNTDRATALTQFNTDQNRVDNNFNTDSQAGVNLFTNERNFNTNQYNTATGNLFSLAQIGQSAANATGNAASNYANASSNIYGSQAQAAAAQANQNASANAGAAGSIAGTVSNFLNTNPNLFGNFGIQPIPTQTSGANPYGGTLAGVGNSFNPNATITNTVPNFSYGAGGF